MGPADVNVNPAPLYEHLTSPLCVPDAGRTEPNNSADNGSSGRGGGEVVPEHYERVPENSPGEEKSRVGGTHGDRVLLIDVVQGDTMEAVRDTQKILQITL